VFQIGTLIGKRLQNNTENWATGSRGPQLHKAKLVQRNSNTVSLTFSAGSLHGTCVAEQAAFTVVALKRKNLVSHGFWVINCSKIHSFGPNQSYQSEIINGMIHKGMKIYH